MKKRIVYILIIFMFALLISLPFIVWYLQPYSFMNVWIIDKTVPNEDYREHKGLHWILNNMKIKNELTNSNFDYKLDY
ncbi:hypothetical protein ACAG39_00305 [Caldicellulosiruptoraceae bacterium PP1]